MAIVDKLLLVMLEIALFNALMARVQGVPPHVRIRDTLPFTRGHSGCYNVSALILIILLVYGVTKLLTENE